MKCCSGSGVAVHGHRVSGTRYRRVRVRSVLWPLVLLFALLVAGCGGGGGGGEGGGGGGGGGAGYVTTPLSELPGPATDLAVMHIPNVVARDAFTPEEVSRDTYGNEIVRTRIVILFADGVTVEQINGLLARLDATIVDAVEGALDLVVRVPDPGDLFTLQALLAEIAAEPFVVLTSEDVRAAPRVLPSNVKADERFFIDNHIAVRAPAAWNARAAIKDPPTFIVADFFGDGPPNADWDYKAGSQTAFWTGSPDSHGYHVFGILAGRFGGADTARGRVTGMFPSTVPLIAIDGRSPALPSAHSLYSEVIRQAARTPGRIVVNTSFGQTCAPIGGQCRPTSTANDWAHRWITRVRNNGLEQRVLHLQAAENIDKVNYPPGVRDARTDSTGSAARLLPVVDPVSGAPVPNLTNTMVVVNARQDYENMEANENPRAKCISDITFLGGDIAAIGSGIYGDDLVPLNPKSVYSFRYANTGVLYEQGNSMATPQVAGLAGYMWSIDPSLTPQGIIGKILDTARAPAQASGTGCLSDGFSPEPVIDAYAAVLSVDRPWAERATAAAASESAPVRAAILDVAGATVEAGANRRFDERDLERFLTQFEQRQGSAYDYSRYDLNGDGRTGGETTDRFDLNADGIYGTVTYTIDDDTVTVNESSLTDLQILCYYAYSPFYAGDPARRDALLQPHRSGCGGTGGGEILVYGRENSLAIIDAADGRILHEAGSQATLLWSWSPDGRYLMGVDAGLGVQTSPGDIYVLNFDFTGRRRLTNVPSSIPNHVVSVFSPLWAPNSRHIAYIERDLKFPERIRHTIYVLDVLSGEQTRIFESVETPDLEFFGLRNLRLGLFDWTPDGRNLWVWRERSETFEFASSQLDLLDVSNGSYEPVISWGTGSNLSGFRHRLSPDGRLIAFMSGTGAADDSVAIKVVGIDGTGLRTLLPRWNSFAVSFSWSPDSRKLLVPSTTEERHLILLNVDGSGSLDLITDSIGVESAGFSPDGKRIAFVELGEIIQGQGRLPELFVMNADGTQRRSLGRGLRFHSWRPN